MVSNTTQVSEEMKQLEKFEVQIADYLGMSAEDLDPTLLLLKLKKKVLHDVDYSQSLVKLRKLHSLRLQYSRAQRRLPVDLDVCPSLQGVSRNHSHRNP